MIADEVGLYNLSIYPKMRSIFSLFVLAGLSVSSGQTVLNGVEGESVSFSAAVKQTGTLTYGVENASPVGDVTAGQFRRLKERVQWDSTTGLFSIDGLKVEDSGRYTVLNNDATSQKTYQYQLALQIKASLPLVKVTHDEPLCSILCTVERGTGVTLTWYRDGQRYGSSPINNGPNAYLPQTVDTGGVYTCEASNGVSKARTTLTVGEHCTVVSLWIYVAGCAIFVLLVCVVVGLVCAILIKADCVTSDKVLGGVIVCSMIFGVFGFIACVHPGYRKYVLGYFKGEKKKSDDRRDPDPL